LLTFDAADGPATGGSMPGKDEPIAAAGAAEDPAGFLFGVFNATRRRFSRS
jgi:hypothetical protein